MLFIIKLKLFFPFVDISGAEMGKLTVSNLYFSSLQWVVLQRFVYPIVKSNGFLSNGEKIKSLDSQIREICLVNNLVILGLIKWMEKCTRNSSID